MSGTRWSLLRRLTDHLWMPIVPVFGGAAIWTFNTAAETSAIRDNDLSKSERVVHTQCWTRVVELAPNSEIIARRTPQDVCGCAVAGLRGRDLSPNVAGLLGDAVHSRRMWIEPLPWDTSRMAGAIEGVTDDVAGVDTALESVLEACD